MIRYKLTQDTRTNSKYQYKWYGRAVCTEVVDLAGMSEHMAKHNTSFTRGQIMSVLTDMTVCIKEILSESKKVKIPDLVIFYPTFHSLPADSAAEFDPRTLVENIRIGATGTGGMSAKALRDVSSIGYQPIVDKPKPPVRNSTGS